MGYELKQLMKMYGVSTPTMAPAPQMPGAAPTAVAELVKPELRAQPVAPVKPVKPSNNAPAAEKEAYQAALTAYNAQKGAYETDLKAWKTESKAYETALKDYNTALPKYQEDLAKYEKDKAAFDESVRKYGLDKAQYDQYAQEYQNRLANTNMYNQAQFSTTGANVPAFTTFSDAQKAALGYGPAVTPTVGAPTVGGGEAAAPVMPQPVPDASNPNPVANPLRVLAGESKTQYLERVKGMGTPDRGQNAPPGMMFGPNDALVPDPNYDGPITIMPVPQPGPQDFSGIGQGGLNQQIQQYMGTNPSMPDLNAYMTRYGLTDYDIRNAMGTGTTYGTPQWTDMLKPPVYQNYAEGGSVRNYQDGSTISGGAGDDVLMGRPAGDMLTPAPAPVVEDPQDAMMAMLARYATPVDRSAEIAAAAERRAAEQKAFEELLMGQVDTQDMAPESKAEMYLRLAAAFGAPTKTGHFSENLALAGQTMADQLAEKSKREREARATRLGVQTELQKMRMDAAREEESALRGMQEGEMEYARDLYKESLKGSEGKFRRATKEEAAAYGAEGGQFGPDGRFYAIDVPQGMAIESDGQGGFRLIQGPGAGKSDKPPTEGQLAGAAYLQRMTKAEAILRDLERTEEVVTIPLEKTLLMGTGAEGYVLNSTEQRVAQAQRDWVRAKLRKESGAVIGAEEMAEEIKTYFPQPGEGPETIAQKAASRRNAEEQMRITSGTAAEQAGEISPEYAPPIRADELARAGIGRGPAPQPVVIDGVTIRKVN